MDVTSSSQPLAAVAVDLLAVAAGESFKTELAALDQAFHGHLLPLLEKKSFTGKPGSAVQLPSMGAVAARDLLILGVGDRSADNLAKAAGRAGRAGRDAGAGSIGLAFGALGAAQPAVVEAVAAGNYTYDRYKPESERTAAADKLVLVGTAAEGGREAAIRAKWQSWTRDLVNAPAADIYPESLAAEAEKALAKLPGVTVEIWDVERCRKEGCVGIVGVGQGSTRPPVYVHVRYRPKTQNGHVALVGKGVTFDSGGLSLKPSGGMQTMRCDMAGAATAFGTIGAVAEMGLPIAVDCFVGAVENMNSGSSYKLGDILVYSNGVSVEIHNTDAEGRLVLADCLIRASREPGVTDIVDLATLTGACVVAIGSDFTGLFTSDNALAAELQAAADENGEGLWRLPLHEPYKQWLKGDWGQIKNISGKPDAGASTAASFLQYFVEGNVRWAHLDIAGAAFLDKGAGMYAAGGTGQMVRSLATWIAKRAVA